MPAYRYPLRPIDLHFMTGLLQRELKMAVRVTRNFERNELIVWTERELSDDEKRKLDDLIAGTLEPVAVYQFDLANLEDEIEKAVGVRPTRVVDRPDAARTAIFFDRRLTAEQEAFMRSIRAGFLRKRKP